jgi:hypothetical protein
LWFLTWGSWGELKELEDTKKKKKKKKKKRLVVLCTEAGRRRGDWNGELGGEGGRVIRVGCG